MDKLILNQIKIITISYYINLSNFKPARLFYLLIFLSILPISMCDRSTETWVENIKRISWVAYTPPTSNPDKGIEASRESIIGDLIVLKQAGFTGLVTYAASGILGTKVPAIADSIGFKGLIMGIWDPFNKEELSNAINSARLSIILGYCIGNEGLGKRYQLQDLTTAIADLKIQTNKPVTSTEELEDYFDADLLKLGDWIFPNVHPYFHNQLDPVLAVKWTREAFEDLQRHSKRFVMLKEVGLPTTGDPQGILSESTQEQYFLELLKTKVNFVYFEGFDQPWKTHLPIEPHWGIFRCDRSPKLLGWSLMVKANPSIKKIPKQFFIYLDAEYSENHFSPTGYMGDCGDIDIDQVFRENPYSGKTCIRINYKAKGQGPNECPYPPPCKWAGVYWQEPPNNWGTDKFWEGKGFNLSSYNRLVFWARSDNDCIIEFKVGGINNKFGDSMSFPRSIHARLSTKWQKIEIDLSGADLQHIIGGFCWATNWDTSPSGVVFYLDDIYFNKL